MTTIAWDGQFIAADKLATLDGNWEKAQWPVKKLHDNRDTGGHRVVIGFSGVVALELDVIKWALNPDAYDWPQYREDLDWGLMVWKDEFQSMYLLGSHYPSAWPIKPPFALGGGKQWALGAMMAGATAMEAIEIASRCHTGSGMGVDFINLVDPQKELDL